ncbi:type II toxin-antitoxin system VapC family toxin [Halogeometricum luteum]|jgi:predicted nucleic acid-binding protein|uniref:Type II toxin-antitoxin system VapC family toxin n=1 Tax=Halogeometricum luteum TaxID=2950537 RepID=A0ABU2G855_9EURY|nr:type II toxin-antitoxin system VapC family toxin [Halogeometricum sp. S3BR5-2]MDS0296980.1 type II toxin-antitoxin system VapC family toxin [Halogeometricum sp. S3BR5-2]
MADPVETPIGTVTAEHFRPGSIRHQAVCGPKFLYALFNPEDQMHPVSRAFMDFVRDGDLPYRRLVVNDHIVDEAATRLKKQASMRNAATFLTTLDKSDLYQLESVTPEVFSDATDTFIEWTDLAASLTDFIVASHMAELEVDHILTYDRHYDAFDVTTLPYRRHE